MSKKGKGKKAKAEPIEPTPKPKQNPRGKPFDARTARLGGFAAAMSMTAAERSENARRAGLASAAKRAAERAALGLPPAKPRWSQRPQPSAQQLSPWIEKVLDADRTKQWSFEELRRQASILMRSEIARYELNTVDKELDE